VQHHRRLFERVHLQQRLLHGELDLLDGGLLHRAFDVLHQLSELREQLLFVVQGQQRCVLHDRRRLQHVVSLLHVDQQLVVDEGVSQLRRIQRLRLRHRRRLYDGADLQRRVLHLWLVVHDFDAMHIGIVVLHE